MTVKRRAAYHHGDLRRALVTATLELVRDQGVTGVSLREVARRAGVSTAAPYHHFADRTALLAAVAEEGFVELVRRITAATAKQKTPAARLVALERTYLTFAFEQPAHYRVMFGPEVNAAATEGSLRHASGALFDGLCALVAEVHGAKAVDARVRLDAALIWAGGHGMVGLVNDGLLQRKQGRLGAPRALAFEATSRLTSLMAATKRAPRGRRRGISASET